jgi:hypothetical protein
LDADAKKESAFNPLRPFSFLRIAKLPSRINGFSKFFHDKLKTADKVRKMEQMVHTICRR